MNEQAELRALMIAGSRATLNRVLLGALAGALRAYYRSSWCGPAAKPTKPRISCMTR